MWFYLILIFILFLGNTTISCNCRLAKMTQKSCLYFSYAYNRTHKKGCCIKKLYSLFAFFCFVLHLPRPRQYYFMSSVSKMSMSLCLYIERKYISIASLNNLDSIFLHALVFLVQIIKIIYANTDAPSPEQLCKVCCFSLFCIHILYNGIVSSITANWICFFHAQQSSDSSSSNSTITISTNHFAL